jgi:hypothetical protein
VKVLLLRPGANSEYNVRFPSLPAGVYRHPDHRFEWTRPEFRSWSQQVADTYGYTVEFRSVGPEDPALGAPTQLALFTRNAGPTGSTGPTSPAGSAAQPRDRRAGEGMRR